ncbi:MAG: hypothetical protein ACREIP_11130, partial [Alphaproteobacteria bacterium]
GLTRGAWAVGGWGGINVPAIVGLAALALIGVLVLLQMRGGDWRRRLGWRAVIGFAALATAFLGVAAGEDRLLAANEQYSARNHPALLSLPLALAAFYAYAHPKLVRIAVLKQAVALCAVMATVSAVWHVNATYQWSRYTAIVRGILDANRGFVDWDTALSELPADQQRLLRMLTFSWVVSPMCIALAPGGKVTTILGRTATNEWRPFDPQAVDTVPRSRFWDLTPYRTALAGQGLAMEPW